MGYLILFVIVLVLVVILMRFWEFIIGVIAIGYGLGKLWRLHKRGELTLKKATLVLSLLVIFLGGFTLFANTVNENLANKRRIASLSPSPVDNESQEPKTISQPDVGPPPAAATPEINAEATRTGNGFRITNLDNFDWVRCFFYADPGALSSEYRAGRYPRKLWIQGPDMKATYPPG